MSDYIKKINKDKSISDKNKLTRIKTKTTKINKEKNKLGCIGLTTIYNLLFKKKQFPEIFKIFSRCDYVYNYCVDLFNDDPDEFNCPWTQTRNIVFTDLFKGKEISNYETLGDEVRAFHDNIKVVIKI